MDPTPISLGDLLALILAFVSLLSGFAFAAGMQHFAAWLQLDRETKDGLERVEYGVTLLQRRLRAPDDILAELAHLLDHRLDRRGRTRQGRSDLDRVRSAFRQLDFPDQRISAIILTHVLVRVFGRDTEAGRRSIRDGPNAYRAVEALSAEGIADELPSDAPEAVRSELQRDALLAIQADARAVDASARGARSIWFLMLATFWLSAALMIVGLALLGHGLDHGVTLPASSHALLRVVVVGFSSFLGLALTAAALFTGVDAARRLLEGRSRSLAAIACDPYEDKPWVIVLEVVLMLGFIVCIGITAAIAPS